MSDPADPHEVDILEDLPKLARWLALYEVLEFIDSKTRRDQGGATADSFEIEAYERIRARLVTQ